MAFRSLLRSRRNSAHRRAVASTAMLVVTDAHPLAPGTGAGPGMPAGHGTASGQFSDRNREARWAWRETVEMLSPVLSAKRSQSVASARTVSSMRLGAWHADDAPRKAGAHVTC